MRAKDKLHFSPDCIFGELSFEDKEKLIDCFRDRVYGFYLNPAKLLNKKKFGFGCGLLCVATIDSLARISSPSKKDGLRFQNWLKNNIDEFKKKDFAKRFYEDFRCGLVHEGRIKNPGEFSYESKEILISDDEVILINPSLLLRKIEEAFEKYLSNLKEDSNVFNRFRDKLKEDFLEEVKRERERD